MNLYIEQKSKEINAIDRNGPINGCGNLNNCSVLLLQLKPNCGDQFPTRHIAPIALTFASRIKIASDPSSFASSRPNTHITAVDTIYDLTSPYSTLRSSWSPLAPPLQIFAIHIRTFEANEHCCNYVIALNARFVCLSVFSVRSPNRFQTRRQAKFEYLDVGAGRSIRGATTYFVLLRRSKVASTTSRLIST